MQMKVIGEQRRYLVFVGELADRRIVGRAAADRLDRAARVERVPVLRSSRFGRPLGRVVLEPLRVDRELSGGRRPPHRTRAGRVAAEQRAALRVVRRRRGIHVADGAGEQRVPARGARGGGFARADIGARRRIDARLGHVAHTGRLGRFVPPTAARAQRAHAALGAIEAQRFSCAI